MSLSFCQKLKETRDIPGLIQEFSSKRVLLKGQLITNAQGPFKVTNLSDTFSEQNISEAIKELGKSFPVHNKENVAANKKLFKWSIKTIQKYCHENSTTMTSHDKFCLEFFMASLSSQLGKNDDSIQHYQSALTILKQSATKQEPWAKDIDIKHMERKLKKHITLSKGPILDIQNKQTLTSEEALSSRTFLNDAEYTVDEIKNIIKGLRAYPFSKLILKVNALNALYNERFSIFFTSGKEEIIVEGGYFNQTNTIRVMLFGRYGEPTAQKHYFNELRSFLFHESTHQAMNDIFNNSLNPYAIDDLEAQKDYHDCIRQVLLNVVNTLFPLHKLTKLDRNTPYEFENAKFQFPHLWSTDMPLGELIENCFSKNGLFSGENVKKLIHINRDNNLALTNKEYAVYIEALVEKLSLVLIEYDLSSLNAEFITNILDPTFAHEPKDLTIIQPLLDYFEKHITPAANAYIENHPAKDRIDDLAIENNAQYSSALTNAKWLLTTEKSPRNAVLGMLMIIIAYITWSIFGALYQ